jgi:peptide-methionine (S)-S-oxide reductase
MQLAASHFRTIAGVAFVLLATGCQRTAPPTLENTVMAADHRSESAKPEASAETSRSLRERAGVRAANTKLEQATFGSGCFWCTEAVFQQLRGVKSVVSGYSNGNVENPTYEDVCTGSTGHAEVIQVTFDPAVISFDELLKVFWQTHDPTTPNQQGNDVGTQYRSAVFYHSDDQRRIAEQYKQQLDASKTFARPIVTEITPIKDFYPAEKYHQNYFNANPSQSYCQFVIRPKVEKFNKEFKSLLKDAAAESK